jgi:hypothetical protein
VPVTTAPGSPRPTPSPRPTTSPRPTPSPSPRPTTSPRPTNAELQAALLTPAELPAIGFQAEPVTSVADGGNLLSGCPFATTGQVNPTAQAQETFSAGNSGPDISEMLLQYPVSIAKGQMAQIAETANACSIFSGNDQGVILRVSVTREAFESFGDETVALRVSADVIRARNLTVNSDLVAVRLGGTVILITNGGIPLDTGLTQTLVSSAFSRAAARL